MDTTNYKSTNVKKVNQFLITFPRWSEITDYKMWADVNLPPCLFVMMCKESHEDGGIHYHLIIHSKSKLTKSSLRSRFEKLFPDDYKRVDYAPIRKNTIDHCVAYLKKEDPFHWSWGEIPKGGRPVKIDIIELNPMRRFIESEIDEKKEAENLENLRWRHFALWMSMNQERVVTREEDWEEFTCYYPKTYQPEVWAVIVDKGHESIYDTKFSHFLGR